jgi:hypothetical protein
MPGPLGGWGSGLIPPWDRQNFWYWAGGTVLPLTVMWPLTHSSGPELLLAGAAESACAAGPTSRARPPRLPIDMAPLNTMR